MELAKREVFWLNTFLPAGGISDTLSPRMIVTGQPIQYDRHCRFNFGEYVQTHEQHDNTMASRTVGALALRPTGNDQAGKLLLFQPGHRTCAQPTASHSPPHANGNDR
jgi:hypothetical protein